MKIMVIDDDGDFLNEITASLTAEGFEVVSFSDGHAAIDEAVLNVPDIIFVDIKMEKISGLHVADRLRQRKETRNVPIVAITGVYTEEAHHMVMKTFGITKCLVKPLKIEEVVETIRTLRSGG